MKAILTLAAAIAFATSPLWSPGFGGFDPNLYPNPQSDPPAQPAGYAFSIWGLIYLWLIAHAGFGLLARADNPDWDGTRWPLIVALVAGTPWIAVATVSPIMATILIWIMLIAAVAALLRSPASERPWLAWPLGLFAGWLTAASFVSIALLGAGYGIVLGETGWAWVVLTAALSAVLAVQSRVPQAPTYGLAAAWAFAAVAVANSGDSLPLTLAACAAALIAAGAAIRAVMRMKTA